MFEKLLSNLPYNPHLVQQFGFYAKRLRKEEAVRKIGLVFIVLAFFVQFFAVISPPVPTVADSTNDLINRGISSAADAANHCNNKKLDYGDILAHYGIKCSDITHHVKTISLSPTAYNNKLYSMGRKPYQLPGEQSVHIKGTQYFWRKLSGWGTASPYKALEFRANGHTWFILYGCGNLVSIGFPTPVKPKPQPKPPKDVCKNVPGVQTSKKDCDVCKNISGIQTKASQCDVCKDKHGVQTKNSQCDKCANKPGVQTKSSDCDVCKNVPGVQTSKKDCDVCKNISGIQTNASQCDVCKDVPGVQTSKSQCVKPCQYNPLVSTDSPECKPCDKSVSSQDTTACVSISKNAADLTQGWTDANTRTAHPNDIIVYTLFAKNSGKAAVTGFVMQEDLSDVLDYATVLDLHGGTIDHSGIVSWPASTIGAGLTLSHQITVRVKNPVPSTPADPADPGHFDLVMTNVYGNAVNIKLPGSTITTIAKTSATLPNTGPGTSLVVAGLIAIVAGYFFARTRLLVDESMIAIQETTSGGL